MKRSNIFFATVIAIVLLIGCDQRFNQQPTNTPIFVEKPKPDVSVILANATELREEKIFLVTLKFKKEQFTLDLWKHAKNEIAAEKRTIVVGEKTFNEYQIGDKISKKGDGWGFVFNGEISEYVIYPTEKRVESQYFWKDERDGNQKEINKEQYDEVIHQLHSANRQLLTVPFSGIVQTYILKKPLAEYQFVEHQPLVRYFVAVRIENQTFTLSLSKLIRNAANTHTITLEVPKSVYEKTGEVWDVKLSTGSFIMKGRLSELHGKVIKKWTETDASYQIANTADSQQFIIRK